MNAAAKEYLTARVMTASPQSLHLLVVDGALRHAARAEAALESSDKSAAHAALKDARAFVSELLSGLDKSAAPEVASNLAALFTFAYRRLVEAELYSSPRHIRDAIKILRVHRETWLELLTRLSSPEPTGAPASPAIPASHATRRAATGYEEYQSRSWSG